MKADAKSLKQIIIDEEPKLFKVPFFQRKYVWEKDEWEELYRSFEDENCDKYLGSLIIKLRTTDKGPCRTYGEIIDGQQRLTTISILTKALYDSIKDENLKYVIKKNNIYKTIFYTNLSSTTTEDMDSVTPEDLTIKIEHSRLDREDYEKVMKYNIVSDDKPKKQDEELKGIIGCYYYYIEKLSKEDDKFKKRMLDNIYKVSKEGDDNERFVLMQLKEKEKREQEIFDTINRAGQTLTHADIIKNDLFKVLIDKHKEKEAKVIKLCDRCWEDVFYNDLAKREYWDQRERLVNIGEKTNIEILLLFIALIKLSKKDKDIEKQKEFVNKCYDNLSSVYKDFINKAKKEEIIKFIEELKVFAELFYTYYREDERFGNIKYDDMVTLTLLSMKNCKLKLIFPCVLHLLFKNFKKVKKEDWRDIEVDDKTERILKRINKYILLNSLCKSINASSNILAKDIMIINNIDNIDKFINSSKKELKEELRGSIENINNQIAKTVLFNMEIDKTNEFDLVDSFNYSSLELEHIMPIKWEKYWSKGINTEEKKEKRQKNIYKLGNMILLKDKMNRKIQNSSFEDKMNGKKIGKRNIPGYKEYATTYKTSKDIVDEYNRKKYKWDELHIDARTEKINKQLVKFFDIK